MAARQFLAAVFEWFIPEGVRQNPIDGSRARNIVGSAVLAAILVPVFSIHYFKLGHYPMAWGIVAAGGFMLLAAFLMKLTGALVLVREFVCATFFGMVVWMCFVNGGIESSSAPWFLLLPVASIFIGGTKSGVFWTTCSVIGIALFSAAHANGWALPTSPIPAELHASLVTRSLIGLSLVLLALALMFEIGKTRSFAKIEQARTQAEASQAAVRQMLEQVRRAVATASNESAQISSRTDSISGTMQHQARQTDQMAGELENLTQLSVDSAARSAEAASQAELTGRIAGEGGAAMSTTLASLADAAGVVSLSAERIEELARRSGEIGNIVQVIREIADQTNLLALNAAIEAARAGETGRGFAVVADEVRKLAERTGSATREIEVKITAILSGTAEAGKAMQTGTEKMQVSTASAAEADGKLREIIAGAQRVAGLIGAVAEHEGQQAERFRGITGEIVALRSDMSDASASTGAISSAVHTLDASVQELDRSMKDFRA
ncbi:methyl-accepting chemotaxis protein [Andreprevotia chitinilytica]|uniref:methyl-accepting chemotaxis protein n=1 Tax=Andreprevotia chitinilytica TaxID=396808 RepID=UPI0005506A9C|nr:methyl-accepting chemotaxis protein [Andreprevotia chitinilytica]